MANKFAKTRDINEPYAIYKDGGGWEWRILKTYKQPKSEAKDPYARWFVAATSPHMDEGKYDYGDTYAAEIQQYGRVAMAETEWVEEYNLSF